MNKPMDAAAFDVDVAGPEPRRKSVQVVVGDVKVGGGAPIVVQSMTNTDTADVKATVEQVAALWRAGSALVRITVDREEAAAAVPHTRDGGGFIAADGDAHEFGAGAPQCSDL